MLSAILIAIFWVALLFTTYPSNWDDNVFVGIFYAVLLGPIVLGIVLFAIASQLPGQEDETGGEDKPPGPPNDIYVIVGVSNSSAIAFGLLLGLVTGWIGPYVLGQPTFPSWAREPYVGYALGGLVFLFFAGFNYQDIVLVSQRRRATRLRFFGIPLFDRTRNIVEPYPISWGWYQHLKGGKSRTLNFEWILELRTPEFGPNSLSRFRQRVIPDLEVLNSIGGEFARWNEGKIFEYKPLVELPDKR